LSSAGVFSASQYRAGGAGFLNFLRAQFACDANCARKKFKKLDARTRCVRARGPPQLQTMAHLMA